MFVVRMQRYERERGWYFHVGLLPLLTLLPLLFGLYQQYLSGESEPAGAELDGEWPPPNRSRRAGPLFVFSPFPLLYSVSYVGQLGWDEDAQGTSVSLGVIACAAVAFIFVRKRVFPALVRFFSGLFDAFFDCLHRLIDGSFPSLGDYLLMRRLRREARGSPSDPKHVGHNARLDRMASTLQKMPTEVFQDRAALMRLDARALKRKLKLRRKMKHMVVMEKEDLVNAVLEQDGSTGTTCAICYCDYEHRDVLRVLRCSHKFHLECADQWLLKAASDYSKQPGCPICNRPVALPPS